MNEKNEFGQIVGFVVENWQPAKFPIKEKMLGQYCKLEHLDISKHAPSLFDSLSIDNFGDSWTYLPYGPFASLEDFCQWLELASSEKDIFFCVILDIEINKPLGICSYLRINPMHGCIEVGHIHFSKLLKRSPAATEAMYLMMNYAFEDLKYRRYEWKCNSLNQASIDAAKRLGFSFEGIFRQCNVFKERNRDTAWFSIIDTEWPRIKGKFQRWLNPDNFDQTGKQKISLREI